MPDLKKVETQEQQDLSNSDVEELPEGQEVEDEIEEQTTDLYQDGIVNFELALALSAQHYEEVFSEKARNDIKVFFVSKNGGMQYIGKGEVFPTNEETLLDRESILVLKSDVLNFLEEMKKNQKGK